MGGKGRPILTDQCQVYKRAFSQAYQINKCRCEGCSAWQKSRKRGKWDPKKRKKSFQKWYSKPESKAIVDKAVHKRQARYDSWTEFWTEENYAAWEALIRERDRLTKRTGVSHHIDHIVPLCMGGPHHPANCRVITAKKNLSRPKDGSDLGRG